MNRAVTPSRDIRIVPCHVQDGLNVPLPIYAVDMHDQMDGGTNLRIGFGGQKRGCAAHQQSAQPEQRSLRAAGMNGSQRPTMSGIHRVQQRPRLGPTNLSKNDAVGDDGGARP